MTVSLWIPGWLPPGLNGPEGLIRQDARRVKKTKRLIRESVIATGVWFPQALRLCPVQTPCRVIWTRRYWSQPMDFTNAAASFKHLEDVLVMMGVLVDDSPTYVAELVTRQEKVKKADHGALVEFEAV